MVEVINVGTLSYSKVSIKFSQWPTIPTRFTIKFPYGGKMPPYGNFIVFLPTRFTIKFSYGDLLDTIKFSYCNYLRFSTER